MSRFSSQSRRARLRSSAQRRAFFQPRLEQLEDRRLLVGSITGRIWLDTDGDGNQDATETANANVTVRLTRFGTTSQATVNGFYAFNNLEAGSYDLEFDLPTGKTLGPTGYGNDATNNDFDTNTTADATIARKIFAFVTDGQTTVLDAGLTDGANLTVFCWNDADGDGVQDTGAPEANGLSEVTVNLQSIYARPAPKTNAAGLVTFNKVRPGTFYLVMAHSTFVPTTKDQGGNDTLDSDIDISGASGDFVLAPGGSVSHVDGGFRDPAVTTGGISGRVWVDNGDGIRQVGEPATGTTHTLSIYKSTNTSVGDADDTFVTSAASNFSTGIYSVSGLAPGNYYVRTTLPANHSMAPQNQGANETIDSDFHTTTLNSGMLTITAGVTVTDVDAGFVAGTASVGNFVWNDLDRDGVQDVGESGLANARVRLYMAGSNVHSAEFITTATGAYSFSGLLAGSYFLQVVPPANYLISPQDNLATTDLLDSDANPTTGQTANFALAAGEINVTKDFGLFLGSAISNFVWHDLNRNGVQDAGEPGLPNVSITLYRSSDNAFIQTRTTDANGLYAFQGLAAGSYYAVISPPSGYILTSYLQGGDTTKDNNFSPANKRTAALAITLGQTRTDVDAGFYRNAWIGDKVWNDANRNGRQDSGEQGVGSVLVKLHAWGIDGRYGTADDTIFGTQTTDGGGNYLFTDVPAGTYYVEFMRPTGSVFTLRDVGDDIGDSDAAFNTGFTRKFTVVNGQTKTDLDAGLLSTSRLDEHVYRDDNCNGVQDPGEPDLPNIPVDLCDPVNGIIGDDDDRHVRTVVTDSSGNAAFIDIGPGTYYFRITILPGYHFSPPGPGSEIETVCDDHGRTGPFTPPPGDNRGGSIGLCPEHGAISGVKWNDQNKNKVRDGGLVIGSRPDIVIAIDISGSTLEPFAGTSVGDVNNDGYANTILDAEVAAGISLVNQLVAAGYGSIARVSVVTFEGVALLKDMDPLVAGVQAGTFVGRDANANTTLDAIEVLRSIRNGAATNYEAALQKSITAFQALATASGNGTLVFLSDGAPTAGGNFTDEVATLQGMGVALRAFGVSELASLSDLKKIDPSAAVYKSGTQLIEAIDLSHTFGYAYEPGIAGVTVYLDLDNDGVLDSNEPRTLTSDDDPDTTDVDETGYYEFDELAAGTYNVRELIPPGYSQTFPGPTSFKHTVVLAAGQTKDHVDFGNAATPELVIDNGDPGYLEAGSWLASGLTGYNNSSSRYSPIANATVTYTPILSPGYYVVSVYKIVHANNTTNAQITIVHQGIVDTQTLNMTTGVSGFVTLGTFYFSGNGNEYVQLTAGSSGNLRADAVKFARLATVVDNGGAGYLESGIWNASGLSGYNNSNTRFSAVSNATATWTPTLPAPGFYAVAIYVVVYAGNSSNAKISISHNGVVENLTLDLNAGTSGFVELGMFYFSGSGNEFVKLAAGTSGNIRADAVRFG